MKQERLRQLAGIGYVNLATFVWASNMVIGRLVRDDIGPLTLAASRFVIAAACFQLLLRRLPPAAKITAREYRLLGAMALTGVVLFSPLLYWGLHFTTAVNGTLINGTGPLLTGLFASLLIGSPMTGRQAAGAVMALAGVIFLISGGSTEFLRQARYNAGDLLVLLSVCFWGLYSVAASRLMATVTAVRATAYSTAMGLPVLCLLALWEMQTVPVAVDARLLLVIVYLGAVPAAIGFSAWNQGVARLGPSGAMVFYNTLPLYGALLGALFLGEPVGIPHAAGGLLIIAGGLWAARR